jgi:hypothetical protein
VSTTPTAQGAAEVGGATWAPLRAAAFRSLWLAQLGSLIGTWMQTVGAQWLLVDRPNASTLVALVQTANMLPALLLALPAGVITRWTGVGCSSSYSCASSSSPAP